ncbi:MAG: histidine kinase [Verrucomicrobia bacterium]|jgi:signal transduction histidine kinase/DNA-binding NarL/FixJ family response regulator|nr:histidine kinase [Verrucomicrobiota bacterium]
MSKLHVLHLEDSSVDALLVKRAMERNGFQVDWKQVTDGEEFSAAIKQGGLDLILVDNGLPGFSGQAALQLARKECPQVPLIFVSGAANEAQVKACLDAGATDFVLKDHLWQLTAALRRLPLGQDTPPVAAPVESPVTQNNRAMHRLVAAVQELSLARSVKAVANVVRRAARELTGADGATFVLREDDKCSYVDEDAIGPLWKGQRFPLSACISGWAMLNRLPAVIPDIYADPRIPVDAYRPTFVKSLVMVPIRTKSPIGAIGNYWAKPHQATPEEVELLQALANTTSVALENIQIHDELEQRVRERTLQLAAANHELEAFSYSVSHDLRTPIRSVDVLTTLITENKENKLVPEGLAYLAKIQEETRNMSGLIDDLLRLARLARIELHFEKVSLSQLATRLAARFQAGTPGRSANFKIQPGLEVNGDAGLLQVVLENLLSNAWKYTSRKSHAEIEFGTLPGTDGTTTFFVRDNGAGFSMSFLDRLFQPFQRLHTQEEFTGNGVGLATVQRIIHRHGGKLWAEAEVDKGATFFFTLPTGAAGPSQ